MRPSSVRFGWRNGGRGARCSSTASACSHLRHARDDALGRRRSPTTSRRAGIAGSNPQPLVSEGVRLMIKPRQCGTASSGILCRQASGLDERPRPSETIDPGHTAQREKKLVRPISAASERTDCGSIPRDPAARLQEMSPDRPGTASPGPSFSEATPAVARTVVSHASRASLAQAFVRRLRTFRRRCREACREPQARRDGCAFRPETGTVTSGRLFIPEGCHHTGRASSPQRRAQYRQGRAGRRSGPLARIEMVSGGDTSRTPRRKASPSCKEPLENRTSRGSALRCCLPAQAPCLLLETGSEPQSFTCLQSALRVDGAAGSSGPG